MDEDAKFYYELAIQALNRLQPVAGSTPYRPDMSQMTKLAARLGLDQDRLSKLRIIHIAGDMGKTSTAAFTERLLRSCGLRTGLFTAPHIAEVRERIRLDGRPIGRLEFVREFWRLHADITGTEAGLGALPVYFRFVVLMALRVFVEHQVDVAIIEVGIGGRNDGTNFVERPWVCGITSLSPPRRDGRISAAGILKPGCFAVTVPNQPRESLQDLIDEAAKVCCRLHMAPSLSQDAIVQLGVRGYQQVNAALALQLTRLWLRRYCHDRGSNECSAAPDLREVVQFSLDLNNPPGDEPLLLQTFPLPAPMVTAIRFTRLPGRCTVISTTVNHGDDDANSTITFYIDGAHTPTSCALAADWFTGFSTSEDKVLIFNRNYKQNPSSLIERLRAVPFTAGLFCPDLIDTERPPPDVVDLRESPETVPHELQRNIDAFNGQIPETHQFNCVRNAVEWVRSRATTERRNIDVLVTGSFCLACSAITTVKRLD